jgi:hypothetical protein
MVFFIHTDRIVSVMIRVARVNGQRLMIIIIVFMFYFFLMYLTRTNMGFNWGPTVSNIKV